MAVVHACVTRVMLTAARRFLVHSIGAYYNLRTWSVTRGTPARREAYVGIREKALKTGHRVSAKNNSSLPQPLWSMV